MSLTSGRRCGSGGQEGGGVAGQSVGDGRERRESLCVGDGRWGKTSHTDVNRIHRSSPMVEHPPRDRSKHRPDLERSHIYTMVRCGVVLVRSLSGCGCGCYMGHASPEPSGAHSAYTQRA